MPHVNDAYYEFDIESIAIDILNESGVLMVADAQDLLSETYPPASEPGNVPHMRSGRLRQEVEYTLIERSDNYPTVVVYSTAPYAEYLEYGTFKMEPRPIWRWLLDEWLGEINRRFLERLSTTFT